MLWGRLNHLCHQCQHPGQNLKKGQSHRRKSKVRWPSWDGQDLWHKGREVDLWSHRERSGHIGLALPQSTRWSGIAQSLLGFSVMTYTTETLAMVSLKGAMGLCCSRTQPYMLLHQLHTLHVNSSPSEWGDFRDLCLCPYQAGWGSKVFL